MSAKSYNDRLKDIEVKYNLVLERYAADLVSAFASARPKGAAHTPPDSKQQLEMINKDLFLLGNQVQSSIDRKIKALGSEGTDAADLRGQLDSSKAKLTQIQGSDAAALPMEQDMGRALLGDWIHLGYYVAGTLLAANYLAHTLA